MQAGPFKLANCTLSNPACTEGYSLQLYDFQVVQYVQESRLLGTGAASSQAGQWLDAGNIHVPKVDVDLRMKEPFPLWKEQVS